MYHLFYSMIGGFHAVVNLQDGEESWKRRESTPILRWPCIICLDPLLLKCQDYFNREQISAVYS